VKTLITGANGFIARYLIKHLQGTTSSDSIFSIGKGTAPVAGVKHIQLDLTDAAKLKSAVDKIVPERVYHLAGHSRVTNNIGMSEYFSKNFLTTRALIQALAPLPRVDVFFSSTVHVYGNQSERVDETSPLLPVSPYGFTKFLAEEAWRAECAKRPSLRVIAGRLYSCVGPGQPEGFVVSDLCRKIASLKEGEPLRVGPLSGNRTFLDVRDAVELFPRLLDAPSPTPFEIVNVASPYEFQIRHVLERLLKISGRSPRVESSGDGAANRFAGLRVNTEKLTARVGARFRPIDDTLRDMYAWALSAKRVEK